MDGPNYLLALALGLVAVVVIFSGSRTLDVPQIAIVRRNFLFTSIARLVFVIVYYEILYAVGLGGFALTDDVNYHWWGAELARSSGPIFGAPLPGVNNPGFIWLTAAVYRIVGPETLIVRCINVIAAGLWLFPVAILADEYGDPVVTRSAIRLVAWMPSITLLGVLHLKDAIAAFLMLVSLAAVVRLRTHPKIGMICGAVAIAALSFVRIDMLPPTIVVGALYWIASTATLGRMRALLSGGLIVAALGVLVLQQYAASAYGGMLSRISSVGEFDMFLARASSLSDEAQVLRWFSIRGVSDLWKLPMSVTATLFVPFPSSWAMRDFHATVAGMANLFFIALVPMTAIGTWASIRSRTISMLPVYGTAIAGLILISIAGLGVIRYKESLVGLLLILTAVGLRERHEYRRTAVGGYMGLCAALLLYAMVKIGVA